jgi:Protein of unknown function (DUF3592)
MKPMTTGFVLFISLFFIVGFAILGSGIHSLLRGRSAANWPVIEGILTECKWEEDNDSEGSTYKVAVNYSYRVNGTEYEGSRIAFGYSGSSARANQQKIYQKLKPAQKVQVRYNPEKPGEAVLAYGLNQSTLLMIVFGLTWLLFTTGFTVLWGLSSRGDGELLGRLVVN